MPNLISLWSALDPRRRVIIAIATVAMFASVIALSRLATAPTMALLYAGMEPAAAGEVVAALEQRSLTYEVRGDSVYVDARRRDETRMTLAAEGLPTNAAAGYELLDQLSGFGTTSQMFDAAYWRAREGELARTIVASPHIRAARVHIAARGNQPFRVEVRPTASVSVTPQGGGLSPAQARSVQHLVAAAVPALRPEDVSVIDGNSGLVHSGDESGPADGAGDERAERLRRGVERLLEARVGRGKAVVEVSVETATETESVSERRFDPDSRVAISSETEERTTSSTESGGAAVTVASNLPEGDAAPGAGRAQSQNSETRERVNYEVSETHRELHRAAGGIQRLSVAVLLEAVESIDENGAVVRTPRPEAEIEALRELVASAVGFDAARGDVITVKSMAFEPEIPAGSFAEPGLWAGLDPMSLAQIGVLALVTLALGLFVVRPILTSAAKDRLPAPSGPDAVTARSLSGPGAATDGAPTGIAALTGEIDEGDYDPARLPALASSRAGQADEEDPVSRLRKLIEERREESVEILRGWMEDREENV